MWRSITQTLRFRNLARKVRGGRKADLISDGYECAVALRRMQIDQAGHVQEMIERLGRQLPERRREAVDKWVDEHAERLPGFRPKDDQDAWAMVQLMIDGEPYSEAFRRRHEARVAAEQLIRHFQERAEERSRLIGKALPNGGSLVVGPNSATVHFGLGGGSVTVVDGKLAYTFPR